jgi:peptide/nickel transport system permease protein
MQINGFNGFLNSWSVRISLTVIISSLLISILGYTICADNTPNANDGLVQIGKQTPGYSVKVIKIRKNYENPKAPWIIRLFTGTQSDYTVLPIESYQLDGLNLRVKIVGKEDYYQEFNLLDVVYPIKKDHPFSSSGTYYTQSGNSIQLQTIDEGEVRITYVDLIEKFERENLHKRTFILGTDRFGRDLYSRLILGTRISVFIGFASVLLSLFIGLILGTISGYFGGLIDNLAMWMMSVVWAVPAIMLVIAISMVLNSKGLWVTFVAVGFTTWVEAARVIRGQVKSLKEMQFVEAARAFGLRDFSIVFRHIVPNIYTTLIVIATANYALAILLEAGLSFLGLSVQPPAPSWGNMVYEGYQVIGTKNSWHLILFPGMAIIIMVLSFNLLGIGLQKAAGTQDQISHLK